MIEVHSPLEIEPDPRGGWQLVFWVGDVGDYKTPFRTMLAEIARALCQHPPRDLQLPAHEEWEDFVEGTLRFGSTTLSIYYEHSLGYLALMSESADVLGEVAARLQPSLSKV